MVIKIGTVRGKLAWALVVGALMGIIGLFAVDGLPSVSAQTDTTAPTISSVIITSDTGDDDSYFDDDGVYGIDDSIKVTVTFSENVSVTGSPQLELDIGGSGKAAAYESVTTTNVVFSYTVAEGVSDDDGIAIGANKLTLSGGTIKDAADNAADLSHGALAVQTGHKVDGVRPHHIVRLLRLKYRRKRRRLHRRRKARYLRSVQRRRSRHRHTPTGTGL